jgi:hypothetical protein
VKILYFDDFRLGVLNANQEVVDVTPLLGEIPRARPQELINHGGLNAFQDGDTVELETERPGSLAIRVSDPLKRTWARETRLERAAKGLSGLTPQLSGKYATA